MKRALIIALAVLALPLLGAPTIRNGSGGEHFYQPLNWMSIIAAWIGMTGGPNVKD